MQVFFLQIREGLYQLSYPSLVFSYLTSNLLPLLYFVFRSTAISNLWDRALFLSNILDPTCKFSTFHPMSFRFKLLIVIYFNTLSSALSLSSLSIGLDSYVQLSSIRLRHLDMRFSSSPPRPASRCLNCIVFVKNRKKRFRSKVADC